MNLTPGRHLCTVAAPANGWFATAGKNETPFIRIPLTISEGALKGTTHVYSAWISDNAYERTMKTLCEVFGWDGDLESLAQQIDNGPFVGKSCSIVCEEEPDHNGNPVVRIKWLNGAEGGGKQMQINAALQLARRLKGKPIGDDMPSGAPVERRAVSQPPVDPLDEGLSDQDIPF